MGRQGRRRKKQTHNKRRRGRCKFDEESSSSSENEINGDVPEESASNSNTIETCKIKDDVSEKSACSSKTTGSFKIKGVHMQAVKAKGDLDKGKGKLPPDDEFNRALKQTRKNVVNIRQESYEDITVFPYRYSDKKSSSADNKRAPPLWVTEVYDEQYIRDNFSDDWLPLNPTLEQIDNFYGQLYQHSFDVSSFSMVSSRVVKVAYKNVLKGKEEIVLKGTPVTSVSDKQIKGMYHIIRVKDTREFGGFLDFLRENSSGYVSAWRWIKDLSQAKTAVWCYFLDLPKIIHILTFLVFVPTKYRSAYSIVEKAKFGFDML